MATCTACVPAAPAHRADPKHAVVVVVVRRTVNIRNNSIIIYMIPCGSGAIERVDATQHGSGRYGISGTTLS